MDIIELALEFYTDFSKFETLANEIMAFEGYPHIKIIGGIDDDGIDAQEVKYYQDDTKTIIFQYSLQKNVSNKVNDTIEKLLANSINFSELVIVTNQQINNVQTLKRKVREKYKRNVNLEIFERKTFITRLSTTHKNSFARYFTDLQKQFESDLFKSKVIFTETSDDILTTSLLKCSLLFTFNNSAKKHRKDLFDTTILAVLVSDNGCTIENLLDTFEVKFDKKIQPEQIKSSLNRLIDKKFIKPKEEKYNPTKIAYEKIEGNNIKVEKSTQALINDIIAKVHYIYPERIDYKTDVIIETNVKRALSGFFRLHGIDYYDANNKNITESVFFNWNILNDQDLIKVALDNLPKKLGEVVVYTIGEVIKKPTDSQAEVLAQWAKAFIGVQIMGLDPILNDFQVNKFSEKTFIIDTDFLLYAIVDNCERSSLYKKLISELIEMNCKVIIPDAVIYEVVRHAEVATRNYNYFRNAFNTIDDLIIETKISNVFVKDFCYLNNTKRTNNSFQDYLSNYYEKSSSYDFMKEIIVRKLPKKIIIEKISNLQNEKFPKDIFEKLSEEIYNETIKTFKSFYRDEEENRKIADNDANFYLTTYYLNKNIPRNKKEILNGKYYLITSSNRAVRCARKLNIFADVIIKPQTIINLLENIGHFNTSTQDIINLLENPFLYSAIEDNWNNIKKLIDAGVDLKNKSITRLSWDLDETIHNYFSSFNDDAVDGNDSENEKSEEEKISSDSLEEYIKFTKDIKSKGYKFIPQVEDLIGSFEKIKNDVKQKDELNKLLEKELKRFNKRKQHYINKIKKKK